MVGSRHLRSARVFVFEQCWHRLPWHQSAGMSMKSAVICYYRAYTAGCHDQTGGLTLQLGYVSDMAQFKCLSGHCDESLVTSIGLALHTLKYEILREGKHLLPLIIFWRIINYCYWFIFIWVCIGFPPKWDGSKNCKKWFIWKWNVSTKM